MTTEQLIEIAENRLKYLGVLIAEYIRIGDIDNITLYQKQYEEAQITLNELKSL